MRLTRQGSIPPPGGAVDIVDQMLELLLVLELHPLVRAPPHIGEEAALEVARERGTWTMK